MTQEHPITPPPELVQQWREQAPRCRDSGIAREDWLITRAAQWGADQELEACLDQLQRWGIQGVDNLRNTRRPKPPSLKEQALIHFESFAATFETSGGDSDLIRRALEQLPDYTSEEL
jgi:hypothetical protein